MALSTPTNAADATARLAELEQKQKAYRYILQSSGNPPYVTTDLVEGKVENFDDLVFSLVALSSVMLDSKIDEAGRTFEGHADKVKRFFSDAWKKITSDTTDDESDYRIDALKDLPIEEALRRRFKASFNPDGDWWKHVPFGGQVLQDEHFAFQHLNGSSPEHLRKVDPVASPIPKYAVFTDEDVGWAGKGGLAAMAASGKLFLVDFVTDLGSWCRSDAARADGCRAAPMALFHVDDDKGCLMPLAIQLMPAGDTMAAHPPLVVTPKDDDDGKNLWTVAKLFVNNAAIVVHTCNEHRMSVNAIVPPAIAARRQMSKDHPVLALMNPFLNFVPELTEFTKNDRTGPVDWMGHVGLNWYQRRLQLRDFNMPRSIDRRGVAAIPNFHWRDDILALWPKFEALARVTVEAYYKSDEDVEQDTELQAWAAALADPSRGAMPGAPTAETGNRFVNRGQVVETATILMFFMSSLHGQDTVNFGYHIWTPSNPLHFNMDPPTSKAAKITTEDVLNALPGPFDKALITQICGILATIKHFDVSRLTTGGDDAHSVPEPEGGYLGGATDDVKAAVRAFYAGLNEVEASMAARNDALAAAGKQPYIGLIPSASTQTIWY